MTKSEQMSFDPFVFGDGKTKSWDGLSARQTVVQSALCHPDWTVADHANYLYMEAGFAPGYIEGLPISTWIEGVTK